MRLYVGITDSDWLRHLAAIPNLDEANFWQPGGRRAFKALAPGDLFLFKPHRMNVIVGGGFFAHWSPLPPSQAWIAFERKNGAASLGEMRARLGTYRKDEPEAPVGCILLEQPFFIPESQWIRGPVDWRAPTQQGKGYDASVGEGKRLWQEVASWLGTGLGRARPFEPQAVYETRRSTPTLIYPRLGQGSFQVLIRDIYDRRCVVTRERTLPVLEAAHIKPVADGGPHDPRNGLLLRSDLHTLFDLGYLTVTPDLKVKVGRRIREEFENGRAYYDLNDRDIATPSIEACRPSPEYLEWHGSERFRG